MSQSVPKFVVVCKVCRENIVAMVQTLPAQPISVKCPLCSECREYSPREVFLVSGYALPAVAAEPPKRSTGPTESSGYHYDSDEGMPLPNRSLVYSGACLIAGIRLAREKQVQVRQPTITVIEESIDLAHEIFNLIFGVSDSPEQKISRN